MPETEDCPLCDGDDQECRYCGVPRIKMPETERRKAAEEGPREIAEQWLNQPNHDLGYKHEGICEDTQIINVQCDLCCIITYMAAFAKEREDSALLEAAGLVCGMCRLGDAPVQLDGKWFHENPPMKCAASAIHERRALKGNG